MAIIDKLTTFHEGSIASTAGTALVGDVMNLKNVRDIGNGKTVYLNIVFTAAVTSGGAATVNIQLASDAQAAIAVDGTASIHWQTGATAIAGLGLGKTYSIALPLEGVPYEQYLGILVVTATATTTAGSIIAFLAPTPIGWQAYPDAVD